MGPMRFCRPQGATLLILALGCGLPGISSAQEAPAYGVEAFTSVDHLDKGYADWRAQGLSLAALPQKTDPQRWLPYGGYRETRRYQLDDREYQLGTWIPLANNQFQWQVEGNFSDTHRVLAKQALGTALQTSFAPGWVGQVAYRRSEFDSGNTEVASVGLERYWGNERFAYTGYLGRPDGSAWASSHRWQWTHEDARGGQWGLSYVYGHETEHDANDFITSEVRSVSISGRQPLSERWQLQWEAGRTDQGDLYTRRGVRLGLRYGF